jgi:hypothetical protein
MTIDYDPNRKRATHRESGIAVEFDKRGPYPQEPDFHYALYIERETIPFSASVSGPSKSELAKGEKIDAVEYFRRMRAENKRYIRVSDFPPGIDKLKSYNENFPEIFTQLLHAVSSEMLKECRVSVYYRPYFHIDRGEWKVEA